MENKDIERALVLCDRSIDDMTGVLGFKPIPVRMKSMVRGVHLSEALNHAKWMIHETRIHLSNGRRDKAFRWLGFIQGVLWARGAVSIDDLKHMNRPEKEIEAEKLVKSLAICMSTLTPAQVDVLYKTLSDDLTALRQKKEGK